MCPYNEAKLKGLKDMTDTSSFQAASIPTIDVFQANAGPVLTETYWGFTVRNTANVQTWVSLLQFTAFLFGAAFLLRYSGFGRCQVQLSNRIRLVCVLGSAPCLQSSGIC